MSSTSWYGWQNLPDLIFNDIMVRVGLESLGDLNNCRQVCQTWNDMIWKMPKDTIRRHHESLATQIRRDWYYDDDDEVHSPCLHEISAAARFAHYGLLGNVRYMILKDVDLASVPPEQLSALASSVSDYIDISNVRNWEVILANIKCELYLGVEIFLESEETEALVGQEWTSEF